MSLCQDHKCIELDSQKAQQNERGTSLTQETIIAYYYFSCAVNGGIETISVEDRAQETTLDCIKNCCRFARVYTIMNTIPHKMDCDFSCKGIL